MKPSLVIIGLGNPGKAYEKTRHNAGFHALDTLAEKFGTGDWKEMSKFQGVGCEARIGVVPVLLLKPHTFMNLSGEAVRKVVDFYKLDVAQNVLVLCDDIDLPIGTPRLRKSGSAGTHNGLKSIIEHVGEGFPRLRLGIGPKPEKVDLASWVVSAFFDEERKVMDGLYAVVPEIVKEFVVEL